MQGTTTTPATTGTDEDNQSRFPESYYCPLTHEVMEDPVVDPEGNSYERSAIEDWLKKNSTSPITRTKLTLTELVPNRALKDAIDQRRRELGMPVAKKSKKDKEVTSGDSHEDEGEDDGTGVTISAVARKKQDASNDEHEVLVSVRTPAGTLRTPADVCCVIDVSGSMGGEATLKTAGGGVEAHGLSLLDIVKHAVKTIICALLPQDRLALVVYSDAARTVLDLTAMDDKAKERATAEVERLGLEGSTNIWDGLNAGLELLRKKSESSNRLSTLLLLTDGLPTTSPPRGEAAMLKRYKEQNPQLSCTVSTFGFGYSINSELLNDVAIEGGGSFAFIPDSSFVGTSFIHAVSNLLSTMAKSATLSLEPLNGATLIGDGVPGGYACQKTSWGASINLYSLQYGQTKDIVVRMSIPSGSTGPYLSATLKYLPTDSATAIDRAVDATARDNSNDEVVVQRCRLFFVDQVRQAMDLMKKNNATGANQVIDALVDELVRAAAATQDDRLKGLLEDAQGQVKEAFSRADWYKKWGSHYLPSLFRAHLLQQCNNFKDPGVQHYGGQLFRKLRDEVDDIFVKLPPPKPSIKKTTSSSGATRSAPVRSMAVYHCSGNPCFAGECLVRLADGKQIPVHQIRKGCSVATADASKPADVLCVVKTACHQGKTQLVELDGGLLVTPYHPVRVNGKWHFPRDLGEIEERPCPAVYSFVLKQEHTMIINGVQCVTLGHEFDEDEVVVHPYFGSRRVVEDLQQMQGWEEGLVELAHGCLARDPVTGLVCGFQQN